jgi:hypothetical protein
VPRGAASATPRAARWLLLAALLPLPAGCASRDVPAPEISAEDAGWQALARYDRNGDGWLDAKELKHCPALQRSLTAFDKNRDGRLTAEEIAERIATYRAAHVGLMGFTCRLTLDGQPLEGATVTFVPEPFLGPAVQPATGVSDARGTACLRTAGAEVPGVACGLFRIEVSRKNASGQETLPARYNTRTVLGLEVAPDAPEQGVLRLPLKGS